jgi:hypothetical protein
MTMAGKTGTLRINLLIEAEADRELYGLLADIPARRRATLLRLWAKQGLASGQLKVDRAEPVVASDTSVPGEAPMPVSEAVVLIPHQDIGSSLSEKETALTNALKAADF